MSYSELRPYKRKANKYNVKDATVRCLNAVRCTVSVGRLVSTVPRNADANLVATTNV